MNLRSFAKARTKIHPYRQNALNIAKENISGKNIQADTESDIKNEFNVNKYHSADLILKNASSVNKEKTDLSIAVKDNIIIKTGNFNEVKTLTSDKTKILDLRERQLIQGLCDSHVHLLIAAEHLQGVDVEDVRTPSELKFRIANFAEKRSDLPAIHVYGLHYLNPALIPAENARNFLDKIVKDRSLFVYAHDLHTAWANTKAVEDSGLLKKMPPYPEMIEELNLTGNIELDDDGVPSGEFREPDVYFLVEGPVRKKYPLKPEQKLEFLKESFHHLASLGITSVHNMGLALPEEDIELLILLLELEERGELPIRVHSSYSVIPDEHMLSDVYYASIIRDKLRSARAGKVTFADLHDFLLKILKEVSTLRHKHSENLKEKHKHLKNNSGFDFIHGFSKDISDHIHHLHAKLHFERRDKRIGEIKKEFLDPDGMFDMMGLKIFMDGVVEKDTAFRMDVKAGEGIPAYTKDELNTLYTYADKAGLQVASHCIGDGSVEYVLDAVEKARKHNAEYDKKRGYKIRHRIEHIEICEKNDIKRFSQLEVTPSMQPLHERPPTTMWHQKVDKKMWPNAFAWKSLLQTNVKLSFGSDWPIVSCNCLESMKRAVNRKPWAEDMPDESLSEDEIIKCFSEHPAFLEYREKCKGQLKPGMYADFVILSDKLSEIDSELLDYIRVLATVSGGKLVFADKERFPELEKL